MRYAFHWRLFGCCLLLGLAGCARSWFEEREPWRHEAEISCLKSGTVKEGPSVAITKAIDGPGACGVDFPLRVAALGETALVSFAEESSAARQVAVAPAATLAFTLADGRTITVKDGWRGTPEEQGFLHDVQSAACTLFTTVLAPGSNAYHDDHMHVDLMRRSSGHIVCQPAALPGEAASFRAGG